MSPSSPAPAYLVSKRMLKCALVFLLLIGAAVCAPAGRADDLHYFKNYFVTGDYTVAGVGLYGKGVGGTATGNSPCSVPNGSDIVAAFLYWQTVETSPATSPSAINGTLVTNPGTNSAVSNAIVGDLIGNPNAPAPACWTPQGLTSSTAFARTYRADVLRYLPVNSALNVRVANGNYSISLPDSGSSSISTVPHTMGATLVVIYRDIADDDSPYKAVVIYDGAYTLTKTSNAFSQTIGGFIRRPVMAPR